MKTKAHIKGMTIYSDLTWHLVNQLKAENLQTETYNELFHKKVIKIKDFDFKPYKLER